MTASDTLQNLSDDELKDLAARIDALLKERHAAARHGAIEQAREILDKVGLTFAHVVGRGKAKTGSGNTSQTAGWSESSSRSATRGTNTSRSASYKAGARFVNPADPSQSWTAGKGRKPKWLTDLEANGEAPAPSEG